MVQLSATGTMLGATLAPTGFANTPSLRAHAGMRLGHNYEAVRSIGRGSFGQAVLAKDGAGKICVMKMIDISNHDQAQQKESANEVLVLASLKHPYIVRYYESFVEDGMLSIVMEYAEGGDLSRRIACQRDTQQLFTEDKVLRWFAQMLLALKYLHSRETLHRDLKPQNLFLTKQDDLRLGDFGISKVLEGRSPNKEKTTIGTPYYFSPEICTDRLYSYASDMWALGCILYEVSALHAPFAADNILGLIWKITECAADPLPDAFSSDLAKLCQDLLSRDPGLRPSAAVLLQQPMIQSRVRNMLAEFPTKSDSSVSPPLSRSGSTASTRSGSTALTRSVSSLQSRQPKPLSPLSQSGSGFQKPISPLGQSGSSFLKPVQQLGSGSMGARKLPSPALKRSTSATRLSPAAGQYGKLLPRVLGQTSSRMLSTSNGGKKAAWAEQRPTPKESEPLVEPFDWIAYCRAAPSLEASRCGAHRPCTRRRGGVGLGGPVFAFCQEVA